MSSRTAGNFGTFALALAFKSGKIIAASAKLLKLAKPAITFGSMTVSMFAYAFWLGPWFSIGFVLMLLIHEMGHVIALRLRGYPTSTPVFIPFLGAAVFAPKFNDRDDEAYVGFGGPLLGSIAAVALFGVWFRMPEETPAAHLVLLISYAAVFLNLFNMIPISPLDGGRVTQAVGKWLRYVGLGGLVALTFFVQEPAFLLLWILVLPEFPFSNKAVPACLGVGCQFAMMVLFYLGYGNQSWVIDLVDVVIATFFNYSLVVRALSGTVREESERPQLAVAQRAKWLWLYLGLTGILIVVQAGYLPELGGSVSLNQVYCNVNLAYMDLGRMQFILAFTAILVAAGVCTRASCIYPH
jgi:Zn-dependent protease